MSGALGNGVSDNLPDISDNVEIPRKQAIRWPSALFVRDSWKAEQDGSQSLISRDRDLKFIHFEMTPMSSRLVMAPHSRYRISR